MNDFDRVQVVAGKGGAPAVQQQTVADLCSTSLHIEARALNESWLP